MDTDTREETPTLWLNMLKSMEIVPFHWVKLRQVEFKYFLTYLLI